MKSNLVEYTDCSESPFNVCRLQESQDTGVMQAVEWRGQEEENRCTAVQLTSQIIIHVQVPDVVQNQIILTHFQLHFLLYFSS